MVDISAYRGIGIFGPAYKITFENDTHAPGSVDRVLQENMIRLCPETADYLYREYTPIKNLYRKGFRPELECYVQKAIVGCESDEERIEGIARFTSHLKEKVSDDLETMRFGGTEEEIIQRGSDWCADVARVGCALCQVAGFPARLVTLIDTEKAYSGHVIIEVHRAGVWGAVDPEMNVIYRHRGGRPASVWELMNDLDLIEHHYRGKPSLYRNGQFRSAAISNYFIWRWREYDYTVSEINNYYRSILEMSTKGWPGELRRLHGEDITLNAGRCGTAGRSAAVQTDSVG